MADSISDLQKDTFYWQRLLRLAGYYHGAIDGIPGNGTRNGTERWLSLIHISEPTRPY